MPLTPKGSKKYPKRMLNNRVNPGAESGKYTEKANQDKLDKVLRSPSGKKALNKAAKAGVQVQNDYKKGNMYYYKNDGSDVDSDVGGNFYAPDQPTGSGRRKSLVYQGAQFARMGVNTDRDWMSSDPMDAARNMSSPASYAPNATTAKLQGKIQAKVEKRITRAKKSDAVGAARKKKK